MGLGADVFSNGVSIGSGNTVDAWSLAIGSDSAAERKSVAAGHDVLLSGFRSLGAGENLTMDSDSGNSVIFGEGSTMTQSYAMFVSGMTNTSTRQNAGLIVGNYNSAWQPSSPALGVGDSNVILGCDNHINENPLTASLDTYGIVLMGIGNKTQQTQSWVMGMGNIGQTNTVTLGTYNQTVANAALIVGNGASDTVRSNGLVVLQNGTVQIPSGNLQLGSESALTPTGATTLISNHLNTNGYLKNEIRSGYGVSGNGLVSIGGFSKSNGVQSIALGSNSSATDSNATAVGYLTNASAQGATAIGYGANATGVGATALGLATHAGGYAEFVVGTANKFSGSSSSAWIYTDSLFVVGNGQSVQNRSNAITTLKNGRTTLTNSFWLADTVTGNEVDASDGEALNVEGHSVLNGNAIVEGNTQLKGDTVLDGKVTLSQPQGDISMGIYN